MKKYVLSSFAGMFAMTFAFILYSFVEMAIFGPDAYKPPMFIDYTERMAFFTAGLLALKLFHSFLLAYLHEKIPRCSSSLFEKATRFAGFASLLIFGPGLFITWLTMPIDPFLIISWGVNGFIQTTVASFVMIPILYKFPASSSACALPKKK